MVGPRNYARAVEAIEEVGKGASVKKACNIACLSVTDFYRAISGARELSLAYARARELRADLLADEIIEIADTDPDANRARNRIQARQWLAGKHNQKMYGERIDLNVSQTISINDALSEAAKRLLSMRDQPGTIDAEIVEPGELSMAEPTDSQTVAVSSPPPADIFE